MPRCDQAATGAVTVDVDRTTIDRHGSRHSALVDVLRMRVTLLAHHRTTVAVSVGAGLLRALGRGARYSAVAVLAVTNQNGAACDTTRDRPLRSVR